MSFDLSTAIHEELPFGVYLKEDKAVYRGLRNTFNTAQRALRKLTETPESLKNQELQGINISAWRILHQNCEDILENKSKDIETMSWWVASMMYGKVPLSDTADALVSVVEYVIENIDNLQPLLPIDKSKGDFPETKFSEINELKMRPFVHLFGESHAGGLLYIPLLNFPLLGEVTFGRYLVAKKNGVINNLQEEIAGIIASESADLVQKIIDFQRINKACADLDKFLKVYAQQSNSYPVTLSYTKQFIEDILLAVRALVKGFNFSWPGETEEVLAKEKLSIENSVESTINEMSSDSVGLSFDDGLTQFNPLNVLVKRDKALKILSVLAQYFRKTEPHSPVGLLLERAVRWGEMDSQELYSEILSQGSAGLAQMTMMTGLESMGYSEKLSKKSFSQSAKTMSKKASKMDNVLVSPAVKSPVSADDLPLDQGANNIDEQQLKKENLPTEDFKW